ncbi:glycosyltransferase family 2 protein [Shewanella sp. BF02_Schw]|uniref:glycosyltransferase family 2 protein n=1 Tax=Shewanella sp. BF02_Schw TaxID=394908 RepID=UPI00177E4B77|nr:glycosyltransferase family A protein [Shewanella sp. BF02_Schw]MBO1895828.1 glycosyltransferase family 2 protein [Shewanella sp. BF02_Schw]
MTNPRFSVVIPLYNKEDHIITSVQSVLSQSFDDFEILVVDDGSIDNSIAKLGDITDPRLIVFSKCNGGVSSARNYGIKHAKGQYIAFLDADDEYEVNFLQEIALLFEGFPQADAGASAYFRCRGNQKTSSFIPANIPISGSIIKGFFKYWALDSFFCASSIAVKASYFYEHDKWFPEGENMGEDQEIWFHIAEQGLLAYLPECLSNYHMGLENSLTATNKLTNELPFIARLRKRIVNEPEDSAKMLFLQKYDIERAINNVLIGNKSEAFKLLRVHGLSFDFIKLKLMLIILLLSPFSAVRVLRRLRRQAK